ncbi:acyltransferase chloroplastic [Raphidocelis subcapitata]|uniref:Acyltransferase chloroplastic n=1 Tax=Raphidocelis subcapitata TaxID=307507 RepID=A0A2V0PIN2_9CHLO|nr:acyltransferase chloroplastic [Raphidocelis subcapitata]|eukprot:GBF99661.1 acyltransferase chloroplastic [Raphidocelis subcapitata]
MHAASTRGHAAAGARSAGRANGAAAAAAAAVGASHTLLGRGRTGRRAPRPARIAQFERPTTAVDDAAGSARPQQQGQPPAAAAPAPSYPAASVNGSGNGNGKPAPFDPLAALSQGLAAAAAGPVQAAAAAAASAAGARRAGDRPLLPTLDLDLLRAAFMGEPMGGGTVADNLITDAGPPRLFSPYDRPLRGEGAPVDASKLPVMFYLPGIDGTGLAAFKQFPRLMAAFDLRCLLVPSSDRSTFEELLDHVEGLVRAQVESDASGRPVYLMGESFGGLLALALGERLGPLVDRLVLVNPATSFIDSPWPQAGPLLPQLPAELYRLLPFGLAPLLSDPVAMARHAVDESGTLIGQASDLMYGLLDLVPQLSALQRVLPRDTLAWRLELLRQGCAYVEPRIASVRQRCLAVAGERDALIPSAEEVARLAKKMQRCRARVLPGRSHAVLQEAGVDLVQIMQSEGFYATTRALSNGRPSAGPTDSGATAFGTPAPIQLPNPAELRADRDSGFVNTIRRLCSPVYYSTLADGTVVQGFDGVPRRPAGGEGRPLLFVGNHGFFALDMYTMIPDMLEATGILPRGLAHPIVFAGPDALRGEQEQPKQQQQQQQPWPFGGASSRRDDGDGGGAGFGSLLSTYGAVPVSAFAMHRLLGNGESVLLYPGGAREAFKRKGEKYQLMWPQQAEFVRLAAKFGATIIPFASIGADEAATQLLDISEIQAINARLPWAAGDQAKQMARIPRARVGVNANMEDIESFGFRLYREVKGSVEGGLGYLLRRRETDPYGDIIPRAAYEATWGWERQAPSFEP